MEQIAVLVVDDSSVMRRSISILLESDPQFFIVGIARNGIDAIEKVQRFKPDIVTMDIEMPEMDGLEALKKIMELCPVPVVMLSNHTEEGAKTTIKALELGAVDFFLKSVLVESEVSSETVKSFLASIKAIAEHWKTAGELIKGQTIARQAESQHHQTGTEIKEKIAGVEAKAKKTLEVFTLEEKGLDSLKQLAEAKISLPHPRTDILVIGCSTGGPSALQAVLPKFPKNVDFPIIVVQHMPPGFTGPLAERFNSICQLSVKEAVDGEALLPGVIYIAPAGFQTYTKRRADGKVILSVDVSSPIETSYAPSVNVTLLSAVSVYKDRLLAVVMTGMGNDGLIGCQEVKRLGGRVVVEAEESCIVYGMPRVIFEAGLADIQVPLPKIYEAILAKL